MAGVPGDRDKSEKEGAGVGRREVFRRMLAAGVVGVTGPDALARAIPLPDGAPPEPLPPSSSRQLASPDDFISKAAMRPKGKSYEATIPDTLDLADRASLALHAMTRNCDPTRDYGVYQGFDFSVSPPRMSEWGFNITPSNLRAIPLMRVMCGSEEDLEVEYQMMRTLLNLVSREGPLAGMVMIPYERDGGNPKGTAYPYITGKMAVAVARWHQRDGNPDWLPWLRFLCDGLKRVAISVDDRAYYPPESSIDPSGTWHWTLRGKPNRATGYVPPDEPVTDQQGLEGAAKIDQSKSMRALLIAYRLTGDQSYLELARKLVREIMKPTMWVDTSQEGYPGYEHGIFAGHFHNNTATLCHLLEFALVTRNEWLKEFVREGYENAHRNGIVRMGWFPSWIMPERYGRPAALHYDCVPDDIPKFAAMLSDAGLGDYWDDADYCIRNQIAEQQVISLDLMRRVCGGGPQDDPLLERFRGGFSHTVGPTALRHWVYAGNTENAACSLYYAWEGITRFREGIATVNLFLNRASSWMDVDSYLPYEGKVVLHNKQARTVLVRVPGWLNGEKIRCRVNRAETQPGHAGNYLVFDRLGANDEIELRFAVPEETDRYFIHDREYTIQYRGSTVVDIQPRNNDPKVYPVYLRDAMKGTHAPLRKTRRFISDRLIDVV